MDLSPFRDWEKEREAMNWHKRGGQFLFPESFLRWLVIWKQLVDYRGLEGVTRQLAQLGLIPLAPDYSTIWHRIHALLPPLRMPTTVT